MLLKRAALTAASIAVVAAGLAPGCGAKTGLGRGRQDAGPAPIPCVTDADCATGDLCAPLFCMEGLCAPATPVNCDDGDECTEDTCVPETAACEHRALSLDQDGDGHQGPRPGFTAGAPGACGDDCDDTSALAYPGAVETCDGVDNDCNGIVDDNARYAPVTMEPVRVSSDELRSSAHGGFAWTGTEYGVTYTGRTARSQNYFKALGRNGESVVEETPVTSTNSDNFTGPLVWTGSMFATAWEDRRVGDTYEIFFNRLNDAGEKLSADLRVTDAPEFSLHPDVVWNGSEFIVAWDDERDGEQAIFARRISIDGALLASEELVTQNSWRAEFPALAEGATTLGLAFTMFDEMSPRLGFRALQPDLSAPGALVTVSTDHVGQGIGLVYNGDRYLLTWERYDVGPGPAVFAATLSETGAVLNSETQLTFGASFARGHSVLALGDRFLLVWADTLDGKYELYSAMYSNDLQEISPRERITFNSTESIGPSAAFGPEGDVGVVFVDWLSGSQQVHFVRLACKAGR
jgi:hypothetical protein